LAHCLVDDLPPEKANQIYLRLTEGKGTHIFAKPTSLANVYAMATGAQIYDPLEEEGRRKTLGFGG
jgi:hypothetical protein